MFQREQRTLLILPSNNEENSGPSNNEENCGERPCLRVFIKDDKKHLLPFYYYMAL